MPGIIPFRIRVGKDDDLDLAFENLPKYIEKSDIIREALRMYFFNAPTPLRDSFIGQTKTEPKALSYDPITPTVIPVSGDVEDKLNKSLGF